MSRSLTLITQLACVFCVLHALGLVLGQQASKMDPPANASAPAEGGSARASGVEKALLAAWSFDEVDGPTCRDSSGHRHDAVAEALWQLPADSRELLTLRYGEDLNILELAVVLGIPAGTVKSRLYHAREQLRQILKGDDL
jgi:DNA-directed RNA polymerase specialized sigma24 family protein